MHSTRICPICSMPLEAPKPHVKTCPGHTGIRTALFDGKAYDKSVHSFRSIKPFDKRLDF